MIHQVNEIPLKIPMALFTDIEKTIPQFIHNHKRPLIVKIVLNKKDKAGSITIATFKL